ncbi:MAG: transglycosylase SLT domain-containing protein [Prevotellaceae bacterium]|jgi:membrane-bound lytic murein transglycosylase MltF|nr:transglycosylase SLT domain-containing protein [Prevotellaceae bacterium]
MNKNKLLKIGFPVITLIFLSLATTAHLPDENRNYTPLHNDTLFCLIVPGDIAKKHQYPVGYHYHLLQQFIKDQNGFLCLTELPDSISVWEALLGKMVRVVVLDAAKDTVPEVMEDRVIAGPSLNAKDHVWVYLKEDFEVMQAMYGWFNSFKHTQQYANITQRFYSGKRDFTYPGYEGKLSPYDDAIKKFSKTIGWDWRLLAALIYQESAFKMHVTSPRGAVGLMQILEGTAERYGIGPKGLYDPELNIKAGTLFIKELSHILRDTLVAQTEQIKFVLAAYNAGPEQLRECRNFALALGKDPNVWSSVANAIPLMRENEYAHLVKRRFKGDETIKFVDEILDRYERYCEIIE